MKSLTLAAACLALLMTVTITGPALAVQPDEVLDNPALEARARELSKELRCLVCRNESIDESNAPLARDLRLLLRDRLLAGDSDAEAIAFIVDRYGEYVLLRPTATGANWVLWAAGPAMMVLAGIVAFGYLRRRSTAPKPQEAALSAVEQERLRQILED